MSIASILAILLAGALIGATGIGGVLVVPALTRFSDFGAAQAIAISGLGFGFPALHAFWLLRAQPAQASLCYPLMAASLPAAAAGALLVHRVPAGALLAGVTALVLFAGARGLRRSHATAQPVPAAPTRLQMAALGALVGLGSALTGTGGPVLLIPLLMLWGQPMALTVAAAQAIQLPVAGAATAAHALAGGLDWTAGCLLGLLLLAGSIAGRRLARDANARHLQIAVSVMLLAVGAWYGWLLF
jgi:hypothetical protein